MFKQTAYRPNKNKNKKIYNLKGVFIVICALLIVSAGYFSAGSILQLAANVKNSIFNNSGNSQNNIQNQSSSAPVIATVSDVKGIYVPIQTLQSAEGINGIISLTKRTGINAVVFDIKGEDGRLNYVSDIPIAVETNAKAENPLDFKSINEKFRTAGVYTIGRIICFKDNHLPKKKYTYSVPLNGGGMWWNAFYWLNPYNTDATEYLYSIADEAAKNGFKEIMLDEVKFPDSGKLYLLDYGEPAKTKTKPQALADFINTMADRVHAKDMKLSLCIYGQGAFNGTVNAESGQTFDFTALKIDYLSPYFQPSTIKNQFSPSIDSTLFANGENQPAALLKAVITETKKRLNDKIMLRPWIQDYSSAVKSYTAEDIKAQINALKETNCKVFLSWNDDGNYIEDGYTD